MAPETRLQRWEKRTEWPLAAVAGVFLLAYSIKVLAQPQGRAGAALAVGTTIAWAVFLVDYLVRLGLASDRLRWFFRNLRSTSLSSRCRFCVRYA